MATYTKLDGAPKIAKAKGPKKDRTHWLYIGVIIAIIAGIAVGIVSPSLGAALKPLGTIFVQLITMLICPIIFCTIVLGIGSVRAAASVGKAGGLALVYFITMSTFALAVGLMVGNFIDPGSGMNIDPNATYDPTAKSSESHGFFDIIAEIIPANVIFPGVQGIASSAVLQTLFVALLVGFAVQSMGEQGEPILGFISHLQRLVFKLLNWILWLAPVGAFGAMAGVVGSSGLNAVGQLAILMFAFYITCFLFVFVVLGLVLWGFTGLNIFKLTKYLGREYLLILATSSSESALPNLMRKMEHAGVEKATVGIVVPTGYSFNLDGTAIYMTMSAIFIADAMHIHMSLGAQIGLLVFMMIASKGAAGVSGAGIATLAAGLQSHSPQLLAGVPVLLGIDKFMSEARALTNFSGNAVATFLVGKWTKTVDLQAAKDVLDGKNPYIASAEDSEVSLRNPEVENPATAVLPPTPQINLEAYEGSVSVKHLEAEEAERASRRRAEELP